MRFYLGERLVYMCRATEGQWALISREACGVVKESDLITFTKKDHEAETEFYKNLDPEAFKRAEELMAKGMLGQTEDGSIVMLPQEGGIKPKRSPEEEARLKTGQYL